jgi:hypothetical protein
MSSAWIGGSCEKPIRATRAPTCGGFCESGVVCTDCPIQAGPSTCERHRTAERYVLICGFSTAELCRDTSAAAAATHKHVSLPDLAETPALVLRNSCSVNSETNRGEIQAISIALKVGQWWKYLLSKFNHHCSAQPRVLIESSLISCARGKDHRDLPI